VDENLILQLKGRAASHLGTANELLVTEWLLGGTLNDLSVPETAAVFSCLLPQSWSDPDSRDDGFDELRGLSSPLRAAVADLRRCGELISTALTECGLGEREAKAVRHVPLELVRATLAWAKGDSFESAWQECRSHAYEGVLVRSLRTLHQLVRETTKAAQALDNAQLQKKLEDTAAAIERGLPFAQSLFTAGS